MFALTALLMVTLFAGTCFGAAATSGALGVNSGVSFTYGPVATGSGAGNTVYVIGGGGAVTEDTSGAWTGVSFYQSRGSDSYTEFWLAPYVAGNQRTGVTVTGVQSPVLIPNPLGGASIFVLTNNYHGYATALDRMKGVTGFALWGVSHDSGNNAAISTYVDTLQRPGSGATDTVVLYPPTYISWFVENSTTVSGNSLFFGTSGTTVGGVNGVAAPGFNTGATLYAFNPSSTGTVNTATTNGRLNFAYESKVSGVVSAPVVWQRSGNGGVSVFILAAPGAQGGFSGVSLIGYDGQDVDRNRNTMNTRGVWNFRINPPFPGNVGLASKSFSSNTAYPTPCLGVGVLNWGKTNYSGNSLFVTDGTGGVSVFNVNTAASTAQAGYEVRFYKYSNDVIPVAGGVTPIGSPVTQGQFLVLPSATGVSVWSGVNSLGANAANRSSNQAGAPVWGTEFTVANGYDVNNWYVAGTPVISRGLLIVPISSNAGQTTGRLRRQGRLVLMDLGTGTIFDSFNLNSAAIASPAAVGQATYAVDYTSSIFRINWTGATVRANDFWGQFKFDAQKTGNNTLDSTPPVPESSSGCFISTLK
jgi:hypothetical protein